MRILMGIILCIAGFSIGLWLEKKKVSRTSSGGVQQFESYKAIWKSRLIEKPVTWLGILIFVYGLWSILFGLIDLIGPAK